MIRQDLSLISSWAKCTNLVWGCLRKILSQHFSTTARQPDLTILNPSPNAVILSIAEKDLMKRTLRVIVRKQ
jgi:hypothetical protein